MKCAVYIRVSTDKEEQKTSLENQQRFFFNIIADRGWDLYRFYVDVESGTNDKKRENLRQLIEDAKGRKFDIILSKELSRLARNGKLSYEIKDVAENNHIHIITFDNAINSLEGNSHMFGLYAWMYEQESQRTSERIKAALSTKAKKGDFNGSNAPYGYKLKDKKLYIAEDGTPDVVRLIFKMYLSGKGVDSIARHLSNKGFPTPAAVAGKKNAGRFWHGSAIKFVLSNPHYVGDLVQGRETTRSVTSTKRDSVPTEKQYIKKNTHLPIISREEFEAVQAFMKSRKKNRTKGKVHLFTNLLFCADCGTGMWFKQNRQGYICGRYSRHGKSACTHRAIKEELLKERVLQDVKIANRKVDKNKLLENQKKEAVQKNNEIRDKIKQIDVEVKEIESKKKRFLDMFADNLITHGEYRSAADDLVEKANQLNIKRSELGASLQFKDIAEDALLLRKTLNKFASHNEVTEEMLHYLVERIDIDKNGKPLITYRSPLMNN
ncbi:recombinase family protein [Rossellomorea oryzaecorticis]|uniref:Recombinase family protein n=1 Tax=Rossellomorea oryzaecorticis TaxID=1396505 RepID=A0ABU9K7H7_9BACI